MARCGAYLGINVHDFPIAFVLEQEPCFTVGYHLEVWRGVGCGGLRFPIIVAQVRRLGQQLFFPLKVRLELLGLQTQRVIDIPADFLTLGVFISNKDNALLWS